jgi:NADH:ubiquinone oxidoreductase subunit F (NADH-binding)
MLPRGASREAIIRELDSMESLDREAIAEVARRTGVPEADVFGVASFYHLVPHVQKRVCQGLTCRMAGSESLLSDLQAKGEDAQPVSCLGQCDRPVAILDSHHELLPVGPRGGVTPDNSELPMNLAGADRRDYSALAAVREMGAEAFLSQLESSGLQGGGGGGFPAHIKMRGVRAQSDTERYVVCNADEAEPGTFKDREIMHRRPHLLLEGLAIAAHVVGAKEIHLYIRGAFTECRRNIEDALAEAGDALAGFSYHFTSGHGAYICGEETALLESLEGKRGMPRLKPPFPTERGFRSKPTLVNNVETLACLPSVALRGGEWFRAQGRTEPGSKLYCLSGHVMNPGVYELPLGVSLDELVAHAGGYRGTPHAFSPGGASSGFLPMGFRDLPLDFASLVNAGSMLGSAGVVVLDDTVDLAFAAWSQATFFEDETCGQCAPCRIGTRLLRRAIERYIHTGDSTLLEPIHDIAWEMEEGSICGLGIAAPLPIITAMKHFPEAFSGGART